MRLGVSTACFYPEKTEITVKRLCESGVPEIEIFFNSSLELEGALFNEIKSIVGANGTKVTSVHPFTSGFEPHMLFSDYERRFYDGAEFCKKYFNAARELGSDIFVLHGDRAVREGFDERYFERYEKLYLLAASYGVYVAQENVSRCRSRDIEFVRKMKNALGDNVRFVLDLKQARRSFVDYRELAGIMGSRLVHLHISDFDDSRDCLLPCDGKADFKEIFRFFSSAGYSGSVVIEVYRENFAGLDEPIKSYKKLIKILSQK